MVFATAGKAGGFQRADGTIGKFYRRHESIIDVHFGGTAAIFKGTLINKSAGHGAYTFHFSHQKTAEIDDVGAQVSQRSTTGYTFIQPPDPTHIIVRHDPFLKIHRPKMVNAA